jgi:phosphatidylinositol glycan class B
VVFWVGICAVTHFLAALLSSGFHHYDEHFAILEHAAYLLGITPKESMHVDFFIQLRPWFPPAVLLFLIQICKTLGIQDPFFWAFTLRLASATLGLISTLFFTECALPFFSSFRTRKICFIFSCFNWFLPYLHAHPSAESWGSSFFFLGLAILCLSLEREISNLAYFSVGILWCLGFQARFQTGIMIATTTVWFWIKKLPSIKKQTTIALGFLITFIACTLLDRWGYGNWVIPAWNYFRDQVLQHKAASAGVDPWWDYFPRSLLQGGFPLSVPLVLGTLLGWLRQPYHLLTFATLPFFLIHCALGHKELRYLFPILQATPFLIGLGLEKIPQFSKMNFPRVIRNLGYLLIFIYLCAISFVPARNEIPLYQFIYKNLPSKTLFYFQTHPYMLADVESHFYRPKDLKLSLITDLSELERQVSSGQIEWLFYPSSFLPSKALENHCHRRSSTWPSVFYSPALLPLAQKAKMRDWAVFECQITASQL